MPGYSLTLAKNGDMEISFSEEFSQDHLKENTTQFLKILVSSLQADKFLSDIDEVLPVNRIRAIAALKALREHQLYQIIKLSDGIQSLACGEMTATQFGFPEFEDDAPDGMFD